MAESESEVKTDQSSSGTGASQSDVAAAIRAAAAASQTAANQAAAAVAALQGAASTFSQTEAVPDISQAEAYMVQLKRLVGGELNVDHQLNAILLGSAQRLTIMAEKALGDYLTLSARLNSNAVGDDGRQRGNDEQTDKYEDIMKSIVSAMVSGEWFKGNAAERAAAASK